MTLEKKEFRELTIDEEFKKLIPPITDQEFELLCESLDKDGCLEPITVWNDTILDGHHRYEYCRLRKIPFWVNRLEFENRDAAKMWMLQHQLARRNLNTFQRCELVLKMKAVISQQAKENQRSGGGAVPLKSANPIDTREKLAHMASTSGDTISKVEKIMAEADEKDLKGLREGNAKIHTIYSKLKLQEERAHLEPAAELEKLVQSLVNGIDARVQKLSEMETEIPCSYRERLISFINKLRTVVDRNETGIATNRV